MMKDSKIIDMALMFFIAILMLSAPPLEAQAYVYSGTNGDDIIYFGYNNTCHNNGPGLLICCVLAGGTTAKRTAALDAGNLEIYGGSGDDLIQAINKDNKADCCFDSFLSLTYRTVQLYGENGDDALIGTKGNQILQGGAGDDFLSGGEGDDNLSGGSGNDFLIGDQGNDNLWGNGDDDILVGGTGYDAIDGGTGSDTFRCRSNASGLRLYDDGDANTDCGDTTAKVSIVTQRRDPYLDWAYMTENRNKTTCHYLTTSNPGRLLRDCLNGASILMSRQIWDQDKEGVGGGSENDNLFGYSLANGDFNGDDFADLAIGVPHEDVGELKFAGAVNVLYGSRDGLTAAENQIWDQGSPGIAGDPEAGDQFGYALASGDFNGDGFNDLAVGVPNERLGDTTVDAGLVNVIYGSRDGLSKDGSQLWTQGSTGILDEPEAGDKFGYSLAAGDFNGDRYDDIAVGAPYENDGTTRYTGLVNVLYGSSEGLISTGNQIWTQGSPGILGSPEAGDSFAWALVAGDFNNDACDDLAVGVPFEKVGTREFAGLVNVLYGSRDGLTAAGNQLWNQDTAGMAEDAEKDDLFGFSLAAGDFNFDSFADLAVGVPGESIGTTESAGAVNVLHGSGSGLTATDLLLKQGGSGIAGTPELNDRFGRALEAGDLNSDGYADLAVGVYGESIGTTETAGGVNIWHGSRDGLIGREKTVWNQGSPGLADGSERGDHFGSALSIGDFNGVGAGDLAVGVPWKDMGEAVDAGAIDIFYSDMPLHTTHKQYGSSCGFTSLNMVMEYLGLADHSQRLYYPRDLDNAASPVSRSEWIAGRAVDVGYLLSTEHIMYEAFNKKRHDEPTWHYKHDPASQNAFMHSDGRLNISDGKLGSFFEIQNDIGNVDWNPITGTTTGRVQKWLEYTDGVGFGGLSYVANQYRDGMREARGLDATIGSGGNFASTSHLKEVIKGFIDHGIPLVMSVEDGGHYNTLIGYWETGSNFYIYTADPLDGWGRPFYNKPMSWRKIPLTQDVIDAKVVHGLMIYGHAATDSWAQEIDRNYHSDILCG